MGSEKETERTETFKIGAGHLRRYDFHVLHYDAQLIFLISHMDKNKPLDQTLATSYLR